MKTDIYLYNKPFQLESGEHLPQLKLGYTILGELNAEKNNVIWVTHALTANSDPSEWWGELVGEHKFFDHQKFCVICVNVLGSCYGSTGPLSINPITNKPYYHEFPEVTIRDVVRSFELLRQHLNITKIHTLIGGSLGGQQALEWAIEAPDLIQHLIVIASNARHSPWGIAFNESQRLAIQSDTTWSTNHRKSGEKGLIAARSIALLSYRNYETYQSTQQDSVDALYDYKATSYQRYQGKKFVNRFNAFSYWYLSKMMDSHNVGRGRGSVEKVLKQIKAKTLVVAINSDILFPVSESRVLTDEIFNSQFEILNSQYGHDGFLIETKKLERCFKNFFKT